MQLLSIFFYALIVLSCTPALAQIEVSSGFLRKSAVPLDVVSIQSDLTARDAIPALIRYEGMTVYVESEGKSYRLVGGITDSDWVEEGSGAGDITGPANSVDNALVLFDGITGKIIKQSALIATDSPGSTILAPALADSGDPSTSLTVGAGSATDTQAGDLTLQAGEGATQAESGTILFITDAVERLRILSDGIFEYASSTVLRFLDSGANSVGLRGPPTISSDYDIILPADPPTNGKALISDGSGQLSWGDAGGKTVQKNYFIDPFFDETTDAALPYREQSASSVGFFDGGGTGYATLTGHGLTTGDPIQLFTTGLYPTGLTPGVTYYANVLDANIFGFSLTPGGAVIAFTDSTGTGTYTVRKYSGGHFTVAAATAGAVLDGSLGLTFTNNATSAVGDGVEILTKTIDPEDRGKTLYLTVFDSGFGTAYIADDLRFKAVDADTGRELPLTQNYLIKREAREYVVPINVNSTTSRIIVSVHMGADNATGDFSTTFGTWSLSPNAPIPGVIERKPQLYTPQNQGFGTLASVNVSYWGIGNTLFVRGTFTTGTADGNEARIYLPPGLTVAGLPSKSPVGLMYRGISTNYNEHTVLAQTGNNYVTMGVASAGTASGVAPQTNRAGNNFGNSEAQLIHFIVPVTGWEESAMLSTTDSMLKGTRFHASRAGTDQTGLAPNNSFVKLNFNSVSGTYDYNKGLAYDTANSRFVVTKAGEYSFTVNAYIDGTNISASGQYQLTLQYTPISTGTPVQIYGLSLPPSTVSTSRGLNSTWTLSLQIGDIIEPYFYSNVNHSSSTLTMQGAVANSYFSGHLIFDPQVFSVAGETELLPVSGFNSGGIVSYAITAGNYGDLSSTQLSAGEYDVCIKGQWSSSSGTTTTNVGIGFSTTSGNSSTGLIEGENFISTTKNTTSGSRNNTTFCSYGIVVPTTTTYYLKAKADTAILNLQLGWSWRFRRIK